MANFASSSLGKRMQLLDEPLQFYSTHYKPMLLTVCLGTATFILRPSVIMAMIVFVFAVVIISTNTSPKLVQERMLFYVS